MKIFAHNEHSGSAKALAGALNIKRIRHKNSRFRPKNAPIVINWGSSHLPQLFDQCRVINDPRFVGRCTNKLSFFQHMRGHPYLIPEWTDDKEVAAGWFKEKNTIVVCRTKLQGHSGEGIVLASKPEELVECRLYVKYIPKKDEYRIHVFDDEVIDVQRKARKLDNENPNFKVRNVANGFIYARDGVEPPEQVITAALETMRHVELVFGAVDVIWNEKNKLAAVLEINTAPGLQGSTITSYVNAFQRLLDKE